VQKTINTRFSFSAHVGGGKSRYLNALDAGRHDEYLTLGTGLRYKMNDHLTSSLDYTFDENWSTLSYSDFTRQIIALTLSSRW